MLRDGGLRRVGRVGRDAWLRLGLGSGAGSTSAGMRRESTRLRRRTAASLRAARRRDDARRVRTVGSSSSCSNAGPGSCSSSSSWKRLPVLRRLAAGFDGRCSAAGASSPPTSGPRRTGPRASRSARSISVGSAPRRRLRSRCSRIASSSKPIRLSLPGPRSVRGSRLSADRPVLAAVASLRTALRRRPRSSASLSPAVDAATPRLAVTRSTPSPSVRATRRPSTAVRMRSAIA